jgi:hypothetical protein
VKILKPVLWKLWRKSSISLFFVVCGLLFVVYGLWFVVDC